MAEKVLTFDNTTAGGIGFRLMEGYPTFEVSEESSTAVERYIIRAIDLTAFVLESFPITFESEAFSSPKRSMPGAPFFVTKKFSAKPLSETLCGNPFGYYTQTDAFTNYYVLEISYEAAQFDDEDKPDPSNPVEFLEHSVASGGEFLLIPPRKITITSENGAVDPLNQPMVDQFQPIVKILPTFDHVLKWKGVARPRWDDIRDRLGKVNNARLAEVFDAPAETALFVGITASQKFTWTGRSVRRSPWDLDFKFSERIAKIGEGDSRVTWNHVYHPDKGWVRVTQQDGTRLYTRANMQTLFANE